MIGLFSIQRNLNMRLLYFSVLLIAIGINISAQGQPAFQRLYGTIDDDEGYSITQCSSGGYLVSGSTSNFYTAIPDLYLLRIGIYGDTIWTWSYSTPDVWDWGTIGIEANDHTLIIGNTCSNDSSYVSIYKYDDWGNRLWIQTYTLDNDPYLSSVISTPDSGIVFCGTMGWATQNIYVVRTDKTGHEIWRRSYGGSIFDDYCGNKVIQTSDNGYIVCGEKGVEGGNSVVNGILIKTDTSGVASWIREYHSTTHSKRYLTDIKQNPDGSYIVAGHDATSETINPVFFPFLMKLNQNGIVLWTKFYGFERVTQSVFNSISDQYIITGAGSNSAVVAKTDLNGNLLWQTSIVSKYENTFLTTALPTSDSGYIITGRAASNAGYGGDDVLVLKANQDGLLTSMHEGITSINSKGFSAWPNPCTEKIEVKCECTTISLSIFDSRGICLFKSSAGADFKAGQTIQTASFPKGLLLIRVITNQGIYSQKVIKL